MGHAHEVGIGAPEASFREQDSNPRPEVPMNALTLPGHPRRSLAPVAMLLLCSLVPAPSAAQISVLPDPLPVRVLPEGRVLRVDLACGDVLWARIVHTAASEGALHLALVEGGVRSVSAETVVRARELSGTIREARFWAEDRTPQGLLTPTRVERLLARPLEGGPIPPAPSSALSLGRTPDATVLASVEMTGRLSLSAGAVAFGAGEGTAGVATGRYALGGVGPVHATAEVLVAAAPNGGQGGASAAVEASWVTGSRSVHLAMETGGSVRVGASWRPARRWSAGVEVLRGSAGDPAASLGARYMGGSVRMEGGFVAQPHHPGSADGRILLRPVLQFRHLR
jgi:hypothetical protein